MKGFGLGPAKSKLQKTNVLAAFGKEKPKTAAGPQKITIALKSTDKIENDVQTMYPVQARPSRPADESDEDEEANEKGSTSNHQSGGWTGASNAAPNSVSQHIMEAPIASLTLRALQMRFAGQQTNLEIAQKLLEKTDMFDPLLDSREARVKALKAEIEFIKSRLKQMEAGKTHEDIEEEAAVAQAEAQAEAARENERTLSLAKNFISWTQGGVYTGEKNEKKERDRERNEKSDRINRREDRQRRKKQRQRHQKRSSNKNEEEEEEGAEGKEVGNGEDFFEFDSSASEEDGGSEDGQVGVERSDCFTGSKYVGKIRNDTLVEVLYTQDGAKEGQWLEAKIEEAYPPRTKESRSGVQDEGDQDESYLVTWLHPTDESMVLCSRYKGGSSVERGKFSKCPDKNCPNHHGSRFPLRRIRKHRQHDALVAAKGKPLDPTTKNIEFSRGDMVLALHRSAGLWFEAKVLRVKSWEEALNNNVQVEYKMDEEDNNKRKWVSVPEVTVLPEECSLEHLRIVRAAMEQREKLRQKRREERREKRHAERAIAAAVAKQERARIREKKAAQRQKREKKLEQLREAQLKAESGGQEESVAVPLPPSGSPSNKASSGGGSLDQYINKLYGSSSSLDEYVNSYQPNNSNEMHESSSNEDEGREGSDVENNSEQKQPLGKKERAKLIRLEKTQKRKLEKEQKERVRMEKEKEEKQNVEQERLEKERVEKEAIEKKEEEKEKQQKKASEKEDSRKKNRHRSRSRSARKRDRKKKSKKNVSRSRSESRSKSRSDSESSVDNKKDKGKKKKGSSSSSSRSRSTRRKKQRRSSRSRSDRRRRNSSSSSRSRSRSSTRSRSRRQTRRRRSAERKRTPSAERRAKKATSATNDKTKQETDKEKKLRAQIERAQELISAVTSSIQLTTADRSKKQKREEGEEETSDSQAEISPDPVSEEEQQADSESAPSEVEDDGGLFQQYEWKTEPLHPIETQTATEVSSETKDNEAAAHETKTEAAVSSEGMQEGPREVEGGTPKPIAPKIGDWEQHTKGIGMKLLTKMGYSDGVGLGKSQQGRLEPIPVDAELSNQNLSVDFHTNAKLRAQAEQQELESRKEKKRKMKKKLLQLPTQKGIYTTAEKVGEFGLINSLFGSSDPVGEEVTDMDVRPEPPPQPKKVNSMGFVSGGNLPEHGEGPAAPAPVVVAAPKGKISDMFMLEQEIAYQKEKVGQLTEQYLRHKSDWTAGPIFKQSLVEAKGKLTKLEAQMMSLQGSLRHDRDKKNKHNKTKKLF